MAIASPIVELSVFTTNILHKTSLMSVSPSLNPFLYHISIPFSSPTHSFCWRKSGQMYGRVEWIIGMGFLFRKSEIARFKYLNNAKAHWLQSIFILSICGNFLLNGAGSSKQLGKNKRRKGDRVRSYHQITFRLHFLWRNQVAVQNNRVQKSISTFFVGNDGKSMISLHTFYTFISVFKFYKHRRHISLWINIFITFLCTYSYWHLSATRT